MLSRFLLSFAGAVAAANPGMLKTLNQMETDEERMLFVSQLHKVSLYWSFGCGSDTKMKSIVISFFVLAGRPFYCATRLQKEECGAGSRQES